MKEKWQKMQRRKKDSFCMNIKMLREWDWVNRMDDFWKEFYGNLISSSVWRFCNVLEMIATHFLDAIFFGSGSFFSLLLYSFYLHSTFVRCASLEQNENEKKVRVAFKLMRNGWAGNSDIEKERDATESFSCHNTKREKERMEWKNGRKKEKWVNKSAPDIS